MDAVGLLETTGEGREKFNCFENKNFTNHIGDPLYEPPHPKYLFSAKQSRSDGGRLLINNLIIVLSVVRLRATDNDKHAIMGSLVNNRMPYNEKQFQSAFSKFIREAHQYGDHMESSAFELKIKKKGKRLNFNHDFQPQQLSKLLQAKHGCVYKKLSDADPSMKPYDASQICYAKAFVVVMWYEPRKLKEMIWIDIDNLMLWRQTNGDPKSINENEARSIGFIYQL